MRGPRSDTFSQKNPASPPSRRSRHPASAATSAVPIRLRPMPPPPPPPPPPLSPPLPGRRLWEKQPQKKKKKENEGAK